MTNGDSPPDERSLVEKLLGIITEVRAGEGPSALLLTLNVFLLLTAYYFIKPVREALILVMESGAEYKSYMGGAIAIALLFAVPAYARFAGRLPRNRLVVGVTLFFVSHLVLFYAASAIEAVRQYLGLLFYLWVGIFNMMVVAQFWAFANDIYVEEQGKRLFPLLGVGASVGAAAGSGIAGFLIEPLGVYQMLLLSGGLLALCAFMTQIVHVRESRKEKFTLEKTKPEKTEEPKPEAKSGAFGMVLKHRYLTLLAAFSLLFTFVNTNGEYMLGKLISAESKNTAAEEVSAGDMTTWLTEDGNLDKARGYYEENKDDEEKGLKGRSFEDARIDAALAVARRDRAGNLIGSAFTTFFFWVNVLGVLLQILVVSRLIKYAGFKASFFILPAIALFDAAAVAIIPALFILRIGKTAENATDYSLNNTLRNMLWLPTTKRMKYIAKQAVDTFFVRMGDVSSGVLVFILAGTLGLGVRGFAISNIVLVGLWLWVASKILKEQEILRKAKEVGELED